MKCESLLKIQDDCCSDCKTQSVLLWRGRRSVQIEDALKLRYFVIFVKNYRQIYKKYKLKKVMGIAIL